MRCAETHVFFARRWKKILVLLLSESFAIALLFTRTHTHTCYFASNSKVKEEKTSTIFLLVSIYMLPKYDQLTASPEIFFKSCSISQWYIFFVFFLHRRDAFSLFLLRDVHKWKTKQKEKLSGRKFIVFHSCNESHCSLSVIKWLSLRSNLVRLNFPSESGKFGKVSFGINLDLFLNEIQFEIAGK